MLIRPSGSVSPSWDAKCRGRSQKAFANPWHLTLLYQRRDETNEDEDEDGHDGHDFHDGHDHDEEEEEHHQPSWLVDSGAIMDRLRSLIGCLCGGDVKATIPSQHQALDGAATIHGMMAYFC